MILPGCFTKKCPIYLLVLAYLTLASVAFAATDERGRGFAENASDSRKLVALVIGNGSYISSPLKNPENDAHSMAAALRRLGFDVEEKTNLGYTEMNRSVEVFRKKLKTGGVGLFYYAGHGMQVNGNNYLIPVDSQIENEREVLYKAVDVGLVLARMGQSRSGLNLIILDACRDNPFSRSSQGLADMNVPNGSFIAYAAAPGNTADDGDGKNGLYTAELVKSLEIPGIPLEQIFKRTLRAVREKSGRKQIPCVTSNMEEEFYFIQPSGMADVQPSSHELPGDSVAMNSARSYGSAALQDSATGEQVENAGGGCRLLSGILGGWFEEESVHEVCSIVFSIGTYNKPRVGRRR